MVQQRYRSRRKQRIASKFNRPEDSGDNDNTIGSDYKR